MPEVWWPAMAERATSERGQAIILFVGIFSVILVMAAIVVDFGLWFAERRSAQRGADLAAAAGALDLPADNGSDEALSAFTNACAWAEANGYETGVEVVVFSRGDDPDLTPCGAPVTSCSAVCDTVRVTVSNSAPRLFTALPFFEIDPFDVGAVAAAGLTSGGTGGVGGVGADQTVLLVDAQARMGNGCNRNPETCAMGRLRTEANNFVETIAGAAGAQVGYAPYTQCYSPPLAATYPCVSRTIVVEPTSAVGQLHAAINGTDPIRSGAANLCLPLLEAQRMFEQAPSNGRRTIILLSNGDNRYNHTTFWNDNLSYPPGKCRPFPFDETFNNAFGPCDPVPVPEERLLDQLTQQMANELKSDRIEIYVVGLNVCGSDDGLTQDSPAYCGGIGDNAQDSVSDQRLLKCIASSPDHYFSVQVGDPDWFFQDIASEIVSRSLLQ